MGIEKDVHDVKKDVESIPQIAENVAILAENDVLESLKLAAAAASYLKPIPLDIKETMQVILEETGMAIKGSFDDGVRICRSSFTLIDKLAGESCVDLKGNDVFIQDLEKMGGSISNIANQLNSYTKIDLSNLTKYYDDVIKAVKSSDSKVISSLARPFSFFSKEIVDFENDLNKLKYFLTNVGSIEKGIKKKMPVDLQKWLPMATVNANESTLVDGEKISIYVIEGLRIIGTSINAVAKSIAETIDWVVETIALDLSVSIDGGLAAAAAAFAGLGSNLFGLTSASLGLMSLLFKIASEIIEAALTILDSAKAIVLDS